jgi:hypothetical protein
MTPDRRHDAMSRRLFRIFWRASPNGEAKKTQWLEGVTDNNVRQLFNIDFNSGFDRCF